MVVVIARTLVSQAKGVALQGRVYVTCNLWPNGDCCAPETNVYVMLLTRFEPITTPPVHRLFCFSYLS